MYSPPQARCICVRPAQSLNASEWKSSVALSNATKQTQLVVHDIANNKSTDKESLII